ncbi:MAG: hypothetical protein K1Y36_15970 [Blastocatellia bacterium]|nr:hypothetical protein [Blastocatellia bacterium]
MREWHWAIIERSQGPDYYFWARFSKDSAEALINLVGEHHPQSYRVNAKFGVSNRRWRKRHLCLLDRYTFEKFEAARWWESRHSYIYGVIEVCDNELSVDNVLPATSYEETEMLVAIARSPQVKWEGWKIMYGGDGYAGGCVAEGTNGEEFLAYLNTV